jgi:hypothetical protein
MFHSLALLEIGKCDQDVISRVELQDLFLHFVNLSVSIVEHA